MPGRTPLARLGRVPPGVWTAVIWCAYTADSLRVYSGLPGMPREPSGLTLSASLILAAAVAAAARVIDTQPQRARDALFEVESAGPDPPLPRSRLGASGRSTAAPNARARS